MSNSDWSEAQACHFEQVWGVLNRARLLSTAKLQWLSNGEIKMVIAQALREDPMYDEDLAIEEASRNWLEGERNSAKLIQTSEAPSASKEWRIDKHGFGLELEKRKKARLSVEAIQDYSARKCLPLGSGAASIKAACHADRSRTNVKDREENEENERRVWARRALEVLVNKKKWADQRHAVSPGGRGQPHREEANAGAPHAKNSSKSLNDREPAAMVVVLSGETLANLGGRRGRLLARPRGRSGKRHNKFF